MKTVRATLTIVKIGSCWKLYVFNGLMIVSDNRQSASDNLQSDADNLQSDADHCRRASDYLLRYQENSRSHHENLLVRADHVLRNLDYCLDDSNSLHDDGDHRHGRTEDGVFHGKNPLKSAPRASFTNIRANFYPHDLEKTLNKGLDTAKTGMHTFYFGDRRTSYLRYRPRLQHPIQDKSVTAPLRIFLIRFN